jgi:L-fuconolactonase
MNLHCLADAFLYFDDMKAMTKQWTVMRAAFCALLTVEILTGIAMAQIVDCHVHLWDLSRPAGLTWIKKDDTVLYRNMLPADFEKIAQANGVTGVVLVQAGQSLPDNQWNLDVTAHQPKLFRGLVGNLSEVIGTEAFAPLFKKLCEDPRYLGYRLSGRYQQGLSEAFYRDLESTAAAGKSVDFLMGGYSFAEIEAIAKRVPKLRIMLDHFGGVRLTEAKLDATWVKEFRSVSQQPNVFCKVSALYGRVEKQPAPKDLAFYQEILDLAFECFGEDRLVYGSDWPVTEATGDYASVLSLTREYFDKKGKQASGKLFHANAEAFYFPSSISGK